MRMLEFIGNHSKSITVAGLLVGLVMLCGIAYAQSGIEEEVGNFAQTLINILYGPLGKVLAMVAFIGCGISLFTGRYGIAATCFMAGILFGFAGKLAEAVFK